MVLWPFLSCGFSIKYIHSFTQGNEGSTGEEERSRRLVLRGKKRKQQQPTATVLRPLYRSVCVKNWGEDFVGAKFYCRVPLLTATSAFGLRRKRWSSPQQYLGLGPRLGGTRAPRRTCNRYATDMLDYQAVTHICVAYNINSVKR